MIIRIFIAVICMLSLPTFGSSAIDLPLKPAIDQSFPNFEAYSTATGVLTDNEHYAVAILTRPIVNNDGYDEMQLAIFRRLEGNSYQFLEKSLSWNYSTLHRIGWGDLRIERYSIFVSFGGATSCCSGFNTELQFKKYGTKFILIGAETKSYGYDDNSEPEQYFEARTSINFLANKVIHAKRVGVRKDNQQELGFGGKTQYHEVAIAFPATRVWELANFHADEYFEFVGKNPLLCGSVDKKNQYVSCKH